MEKSSTAVELNMLSSNFQIEQTRSSVSFSLSFISSYTGRKHSLYLTEVSLIVDTFGVKLSTQVWDVVNAAK